MIKRLEYIKDIVDQNYIGINIYQNEALPYLSKLEEVLDDEFEEYTNLQKDRDRGHYHITVINVMEYNQLSKKSGFINQMEDLFKKEISDIKLMGLGTATKNNNRTFFVVVRSEELQEIRSMFGLSNQDFHITLGFKYKDCFGVRKNEVMEDFSKFLKLLKQEYYKSENFEFVREIGNFSMGMYDEIIPVDISKNYLKVLCGGFYMDITWLDTKFWIMTKYPAIEKLPRLSKNAISQIL